MAEQGQLFSLDFVISVTLIVLAIAVTVQALELNNYSARQALAYRELRETAGHASQLLASNAAWNCTLELDNGETVPLDNCLDTGKGMDKARLGLPEAFGCRVEGVEVRGCGETAPREAEVAGVKRVVVFGSRLTRDEFRNCRQGQACSLTEPKEVGVSVWRK